MPAIAYKSNFCETCCMVVLAGPRVRCSSTVASTIRRRVSRWRSARFFISYLRFFTVISLNTLSSDIDKEIR